MSYPQDNNHKAFTMHVQNQEHNQQVFTMCPKPGAQPIPSPVKIIIHPVAHKNIINAITTILSPTRTQSKRYHLSCYPQDNNHETLPMRYYPSCYPQEHNHTLSMHYPCNMYYPYIVHALSMQYVLSILLSTRTHNHELPMHSHPCIMNHLVTHKNIIMLYQPSCYPQEYSHALSMQPSCYPQETYLYIIHALFVHHVFMHCSCKQSCYPQEHNHALAMHSHPCIFIHAISFVHCHSS